MFLKIRANITLLIDYGSWLLEIDIADNKKNPSPNTARETE
jgi:hypothetical protein